jgi:TPR repeat protein
MLGRNKLQLIISLFGIIASVHLLIALASEETPQSEPLESAKSAFYRNELDLAYAKFKTLVQQGHPEAYYYLSLIHRRSGKYYDTRQAFKLLQQAAAKNHPSAMRDLGMAYERGEGVEANMLIAIDWYRQADKFEKIDASLIQFFTSENGELVEQTAQQQIERLKQAASRGDLNATYQLAKLHDTGALIEQDLGEAVRWYTTAAKAGHSYSSLMLGYFLCRGIGVDKNIVEANHWFKQSGRKVTCEE